MRIYRWRLSPGLSVSFGVFHVAVFHDDGWRFAAWRFPDTIIPFRAFMWPPYQHLAGLNAKEENKHGNG